MEPKHDQGDVERSQPEVLEPVCLLEQHWVEVQACCEETTNER
jgi:hypothetical protein